MNKLFLTCSGFVVNYIVHSVCQERITQLLFKFQIVQGWRLKWESFSITYPVNSKRQWLNEQRWLVEPLQCMIFTWWRVVLYFEWAAKQIVVHYPLWSKGSLDWMTCVKKMIVAKINLWKFVHCGGKLILMFSTLFFTSVYVCCQELQM